MSLSSRHCALSHTDRHSASSSSSSCSSMHSPLSRSLIAIKSFVAHLALCLTLHRHKMCTWESHFVVVVVVVVGLQRRFPSCMKKVHMLTFFLIQRLSFLPCALFIRSKCSLWMEKEILGIASDFFFFLFAFFSFFLVKSANFTSRQKIESNWSVRSRARWEFSHGPSQAHRSSQCEHFKAQKISFWECKNVRQARWGFFSDSHKNSQN